MHLKPLLLFLMVPVPSAPVIAQSVSRADSALVDFTGDGLAEAWTVDTAAVPDGGLRVTMSIIQKGKVLYTETAIVRRPTDPKALERLVRLDHRRLQVLDTLPEKDWSVDEPWYDQARATLIDRERVDSGIARAVVGELLQERRIVLQSYAGKDASLYRAWSNRLGRFVVIGTCC